MPNRMIDPFRSSTPYSLDTGRSCRPWKLPSQPSLLPAPLALFLISSDNEIGATSSILLCDFDRSSKPFMEASYIGVLFPASRMLSASSLLRRRDFDYCLPLSHL